MSKENHIIDQLSDFVTGWIAGKNQHKHLVFAKH